MYFLLLLLSTCSIAIAQEMNLSPFINLLRPESMSKMAEIATQLSSLAAQNVANNERDVMKTIDEPREVVLNQDSRPSAIFGQAMSNIASQSRSAFLGALSPLEGRPRDVIPVENHESVAHAAKTFTQDNKESTDEQQHPQNQLKIRSLIPSRPVEASTVGINGQDSTPLPSSQSEVRFSPIDEAAAAGAAAGSAAADQISVDLPKPVVESAQNAIQPNPLLRLAESFLRGAAGPSSDASQAASSSSTQEQNIGGIPQLGINDFMPGAKNNFGIPKGHGCLPFLSEFMQVAYGNCQQVADEKAFDAWGEELKSAILTGKIDLLRASQETCRRGAERQQCASLRQAIATCDVIASLQIGAQLQRAMKRCDEVSGLVDQNPLAVLGQINNLVSGEFAQGFFNKFLTGG